MKRILILLSCIFNVVCGYSQSNIQAVDLGLPSGTMWGNMNIGAKSVKDPGDYYMWGRTKKTRKTGIKYYCFQDDSHAFSKYNEDDKLTELQKSDDVANLQLGGAWHTPTKQEMQELLDFCCLVNENTSVRFVGPNGNSISIPYTEGQIENTHKKSELHLWTSSLKEEYNNYFDAYVLFGANGENEVLYQVRYAANYVRPVCAGNKTYTYNQPDVSLKNVINDSQKLSFDIEIVSPNIKILNDEIWINKKNTNYVNGLRPYGFFEERQRPMALTDGDNYSIKDNICLDKQKNPDLFKSLGPIRCQIGVETGLGKEWYTYYIDGNKVTDGGQTDAEIPTLNFNSPSISTSSDYDLNISVNSNFAITSTKVMFNGNDINGVAPVENVGDSYDLIELLNLKKGDNSIHVEVTNATGTASLDKIVTYSETASIPVQSVKKQKVAILDSHIKKVALVIGNASYEKSPLKSPLNDADDVSAKLKSLGFDVITAKDCKTRWDMEKFIDEFCDKAQNADAGLFYYAGHGMQLPKTGGDYLIPTMASMSTEAKAKEYCVSFDYVLNRMDESGINMKIAIIDACRDNPFRIWSRGGKRGLAAIAKPPYGTFIAFATGTDEVVTDGNDRNSIFTKALLTALDDDDLEINKVFTTVKRIVKNKTNGRQHPWIFKDLSERFYFGQGK